MIIGKGGVLGIDIGSSSIKVVELEEIGTKYSLKNIGEVPIGQGLIVGKSIEHSDAVSGILSGLLDDLGVESDDAAVSISGDPALIKRVSLPRMTDAEIKKSIKWEMEQLGSGGIPEFNYDYQVLQTNNSNDKIDVLIVAVNRNVTREYLSVLSNVGLNPVIIDLDVFSLENMYQVNYPDTQGLLALVNIGAAVTNILIIHNGESVFARDLAIGGSMYTKLIMTDMELSYDQAEEVKHIQMAGLLDPRLEILSKNFIKSISKEIKVTLDYFSSAHGCENVKRIMIGGGSANLPGLKEYLSEQTEAYVGILNPFRNIGISEDIFDPDYIRDISAKMSVATGLALNRA